MRCVSLQCAMRFSYCALWAASVTQLHDRALVRPQREPAAHRLPRTICGGGYEQPADAFAGLQTVRRAGKIERNEEPFASMLAGKDQKIPLGTDAAITAKRQRRTFAAQIDQAAVEPIERRCIAALRENVVLRKPEGQPRLGRRKTGMGRAVPLHRGAAAVPAKAGNGLSQGIAE